jgi:protein SCO1/2
LAATAAPAASGGGVPALDARAALQAAQAVVGRTPPDYTLLDREGRPFKLSSLRGKPLLLSFIYTGCFEACPLQTRALLEAVRGLDRLVGPERYHVLSIGFNQPFDSPLAMRAYAAQHGVARSNWEFLSPHPSIVAALTRDYGFSYVATPAGFDHVLGVTVVDAEGRIAAQVYGDRPGADQIGEPLKRLLLGEVLSERPGLAEVVERVRLLCTVYDPQTGRYRYNYALLFEVIGGLAFFATVAGYFVAEWRARRRARRTRAAPGAVVRTAAN